MAQSSCAAEACLAAGTATCGRCLVTAYCSVLCQRAHWATHKPRCKELAESNAHCAAELPPRALRIPGVYAGLESRVVDYHCALPSCSAAQDRAGPDIALCGGCRVVLYCGRACQVAHYGAHKACCFEAIRARVCTGDVHKDDAGGEHVLRDWLADCARDHGQLDARTLLATSTLGQLLRFLGRLDAAEPLLRRCVVGRRAALGPGHRDTLVSLNNLATLLQEQGRLDEAGRMFRATLEATRNALGPTHPSTFASTNNLAVLLLEQGKLEEAEPLLREALSGTSCLAVAEHTSSRVNLANLLQRQGKLGEAEVLYRDALAVRACTLGSQHPSALDTQSKLAGVLQEQGKLGEAGQLYREAFEGRRSTLGPTHRTTLTSMQSLAGVLLDLGRLGEAEPLFRGLLTALQDAPGSSLSALGATDDFALLLMRQGKLSEAEQWARKALQARRGVQGARHPHALRSAFSIGFLLKAQGRLDKAYTLLHETLVLQWEVLGPLSRDTQNTYVHLLSLLVSMGRVSEARELRAKYGEAEKGRVT